MRVTIDLTDQQIEALDRLASEEKCSRASLIRQAVADYLAKHAEASLEAAFGIWRHRDIDGLDYQRALRNEW